MKQANRTKVVLVGCVALMFASCVWAQDWPQWRGPNRDGKVSKFAAPEKWPAELTQKWKLEVGVGTDSSPALVGDRLYVFTRQGGDEVTLCLNADTGKEIWKDKYEAEARTSADRGHAGPRSSPAVANGMAVTFGISGTLSCLDASSGNLKWRKNDFPGDLPRFNTAMSPIIVDNLVIGQFGGQNNAAVAVYDLAGGDQKWKWSSPGASHSSPSVMTVAGTKTVVVMTAKNVVGINVANGTLLWEMPFDPGRSRQCTTPIIDGQTVICCGGQGRGMKAVKIKKQGDKFVLEELWTYTDNYVEYNTPVLKNGLLFAFSNRGSFFCVDAKTGQTAWTQPSASARLEDLTGGVARAPAVFASQRGGGMRGGRGGMRGGRRGGMGGGGFGSVVDAGKVLIGLNSSAKLVVFQPAKDAYKELASYKVSEGQTYAYPVVSGKRIFIRDQETVAMWAIE
ncbi:MAG: outer membrane protein assembly factor BamB family protein [Planctomycetota bacterium]